MCTPCRRAAAQAATLAQANAGGGAVLPMSSSCIPAFQATVQALCAGSPGARWVAPPRRRSRQAERCRRCRQHPLARQALRRLPSQPSTHACCRGQVKIHVKHRARWLQPATQLWSPDQAACSSRHLSKWPDGCGMAARAPNCCHSAAGSSPDTGDARACAIAAASPAASSSSRAAKVPRLLCGMLSIQICIGWRGQQTARLNYCSHRGRRRRRGRRAGPAGATASGTACPLRFQIRSRFVCASKETVAMSAQSCASDSDTLALCLACNKLARSCV